MPPLYPASVNLYAYLEGAWVDLTTYQVGRINASWGIAGSGPIDFMAETGTLTFDLQNETGIFSPSGASPISPDWKKGTAVLLEITAIGQKRNWYGRIDDFSFDSDPEHPAPLVTVYVVDWMDKLAKYPINYPDIVFDKTADEIVQIIIDALPVAPLEQTLAVGTNTFPVVFDTATDFTRARTEINKVLLSELCYFYVRHRGTLGENLVLENANSRVTPTSVRLPEFLLMEDGFALLKEDGFGIVLEGTGESFDVLEGQALALDTSFGDNVVNDIMFRYTPKRHSLAAPEANYVWTSPLQPQPTTLEPDGYNILLSIAPGETKIINTKWGIYDNQVGPVTDEEKFFESAGDNSKLQISPPFPTGFYWLYMYDSGSYELSGTDITADLVVNSFEAFADHFVASLTNNNATKRGYIEAMILRTPASASELIITEPDVPVVVQSAVSILEHDHQPINFDQVYQTDGGDGAIFATRILADEVNPRTTLERINLCANKESYWMKVFMGIDIGDYFPVVDENRGIDGDFFVQNMTFSIDPGGIIFFSLGVKGGAKYGQVTVGDSYSISGNSVSTLTLTSVVVSSTPDPVIFVTIAKRAYNEVTSVVRGSQNFTLYRAAEFADGDYPRYEIWQLTGPTVGTENIVVTLPGVDYMQAGAIVFYGANQYCPVRSYVEDQGTSFGPILGITDTSGNDIILDFLSISKRTLPEANPTLTPGAGQTEWMNASGDSNWAGAASTIPGSSIYENTVDWTNSSLLPHNWIYVALSIRGLPI